jgi:hemerythrin-like metal-binding protein
MELFKWDEKYSLGNTKIDEQHKAIVDVINSLNEEVSKGRGEEILKVVIAQLTSFVFDHFDYEEEYFKKYNYPNYKEHVKGHDEFRKKYNKLIKDINTKGYDTAVVLDFGSLVIPWIRDHIQKENEEFHDFWVQVQKDQEKE